MSFPDTKPFEGRSVRFATDALALDHLPRSGTGIVRSVTPLEIVLDVPGDGEIRLPLWRVLTLKAER